MDKIVVKGGKKLQGTVYTSGAKNSALPILFSSLLAEGDHIFHNVPRLKDIDSTCELLKSLNCECEFIGANTLKVTVKKPSTLEAHYDLVRKMRASILCLGPLLARYGEAIVSLPGGCAIGTRPIDLHIEAMKCLGAEITINEGYVKAKASKLIGHSVLFESATVGGTENLLMAAVLAEGTTIVENAAKEPEIIDLAEYLNKMGAKISGHGTSVIRIDGVSELKPAEHTVMPDRIEAGTLLLAGAITGGEVTVMGCPPHIIESLVVKLRESGFKVDVENQGVTIREARSWRAVDLSTAPYPLFPTDLQAQFMALTTLAEGRSVITETVFENRFMHVQELTRLGADISPKSRVAVVRGVEKLTGAQVMATDLRASASLVLAGLAATGHTTISRIYHLDRGYEKLEDKLAQLGADIQRAH